jgi:hypothetical protein
MVGLNKIWLWIIGAVLAVGGVYLWIAHSAHLAGAIFVLPLLLCPLMHLFMHHDHGRHEQQNKAEMR